MTLKVVDKMDKGTDLLPFFCKIFANRVRVKILEILKVNSHSFGSMLKNLEVNPKVLSDNLNLLMSHGLVTKSYPYGVYTLTPAGYLAKKAIETFDLELSKVAEALDRSGKRV